jgi:signal transduction histidine kinase
LIDDVSRLAVELSEPMTAFDQILGEIVGTLNLCGILLYTGVPPVLHAAQCGFEFPQGSLLTEGLAQQAYRTARSLTSNHVKQDARCKVPAGLRSEVWSEAAIPLFYQEKVMGVVDCFGPQGHTFDSDDLQTLRILGRLVTPLVRQTMPEGSHNALGIRSAPVGYFNQGSDGSQTQLQAAYQQLQEFAELKDQILQNISHELRTPLTLIQGHVELVLEDTSGRLTPAQRRGLEVVLRKSDDVVNIVQKIVSLSPLSSFALNYTSIPVGPLLTSMAQLVRKGVRDRPIQIEVDPVKPDLSIYGDFDKIKQVCYNILDNSIKFSPHGGDIVLSAAPEGEYVHLQFRDHGVGIPQKRISRIFDTFYQVDGSSTRRFGGLGLGLTVVHRVVEAHHGKVWAESEVDRGSVFHVLLPRYQEPSQAEEGFQRG